MAATDKQHTLDEEIKCLIREIGLRKTVYPKWVEKGSKTQEEAEYEISVMTSALNRLKAFRYLFSAL